MEKAKKIDSLKSSELSKEQAKTILGGADPKDPKDPTCPECRSGLPDPDPTCPECRSGVPDPDPTCPECRSGFTGGKLGDYVGVFTEKI